MEGYQFFEHLTWFSVKLLRQSGRIRVGGKESRLWERKGPLLVTDKGITK